MPSSLMLRLSPLWQLPPQMTSATPSLSRNIARRRRGVSFSVSTRLMSLVASLVSTAPSSIAPRPPRPLQRLLRALRLALLSSVRLPLLATLSSLMASFLLMSQSLTLCRKTVSTPAGKLVQLAIAPTWTRCLLLPPGRFGPSCASFMTHTRTVLSSC